MDDFPLSEIVPYIDWSPFFMAWELKGKYPRIFDDPQIGPVATELYDHARELLDQIVAGRLLQARAVYGFWPAAAEDDDILIYADPERTTQLVEVPHFETAVGADKGRTRFVRCPTMSLHVNVNCTTMSADSS